MRTQMEKLRQTTDPAERQRLLQEHLQTMQDVVRVLDGMMEAQAAAATPQMGMMGQGMMGGGMMGGGMMGKGMMGRGGTGGCMMPGMMSDDDQKGMMGRGMMGGGGMGGGMMRSMMMQRHMMMEQQMQSVVNRLNLMEKRLNGMQTLLDQVLQHMAATQGQG
jgi:hypothetical protein